MNQQPQTQANVPVEENVLFGIVGAFLFSLAGGILYYVLYMIGMLSALSALVAVICAIRGYALFAKKESTKGVVISVIIAAVVIIVAWYACFCADMVPVYQEALANGEVDWAPANIFEYIPYGVLDLTVNPAYFGDLLWNMVFGGLACVFYLVNQSKQKKAAEAQRMASEQAAAVAAAEGAYGENDPVASETYTETPDNVQDNTENL